MSKVPVTLFVCTGKDCSRAWRRIGADSPRKWLKRQLKEAGLPYKLNLVETECMDRCEQAGNLCCVVEDSAALVSDVRSHDDVDRVLAALRACVERSAAERQDLPRGP